MQDSKKYLMQAGRQSIILKTDVKDAFRNVPVAPQHQWLLGFAWKEKFYKETGLSFRFSTAPFVFNLFGEGLHWLLIAYLHWVLCHYLNDFIAIFSAPKANLERLKFEANAYIWLTDLLRIPRNNSKGQMGTELSVFRIEIDTSSFTAKLPRDKLERAIRWTGEVLAANSVSLLDIQSLVKYIF